jgi:hypothetical protein
MKKQLFFQQRKRLLMLKPAKVITIIFSVSLIFITGCKKEVQSGEPITSVTNAEALSKLPKEMPAPLIAKFGKSTTSSPNQRTSPGSVATDVLQIHPEYREMILRALKLSTTTCNDNTSLNQWLGQRLSNWNSTVITYAVNTAMLDLPLYYSLVFENSSSNQYFGKNGEYSHIMAKTFKDLKRFWNIQSDNIVLAGMHGATLRDPAKIFKTYRAVYGLGPEDAQYYTDLVSALLKAFPQYENGDHPIFTFNSFSLSSFSDPYLGTIPSKIIMGDGIMEGFEAIGFKDVAPQAILAHEFGHQIQFQLNVFGTATGPEATRRTELMADAYSAYYLSHARGASMQWKRIQQFLQVFFNIGDCSVTSDGHHGTPSQRMASANWAYQLANNQQKQGFILSSQEFTALFEAALPEILTH